MKLKRWQKILLFIFFIGLGFRLTSRPAPVHPYYASDSSDTLVIAHQVGDGIITNRPDIMLEILGR